MDQSKRAPTNRLHVDDFLAEYKDMIEKAATKGSFFVTMKPTEHGTCLVRCRYRDRKSVAEVTHKDLIKVNQRLAAIHKSAWTTTMPKKATKRALNNSSARKRVIKE